MVLLVLVTRGVGEVVRDVVGVVVDDVDGVILVVGGRRVGVGVSGAKDAGEGVGCTAVAVHWVGVVVVLVFGEGVGCTDVAAHFVGVTGDVVRGVGVTGRRTGSVVSGIIAGAAHVVDGGVEVEECCTVVMCEVVVVVVLKLSLLKISECLSGFL